MLKFSSKHSFKLNIPYISNKIFRIFQRKCGSKYCKFLNSELRGYFSANITSLLEQLPAKHVKENILSMSKSEPIFRNEL